MRQENSVHLLNVKEVALRARLHPQTIYRHIYSGDLRAVQLGGRKCPLRIREDEFNAWAFGDPREAA